MELLGVGAPEFAFIILLAIIFVGPKRMAEAGTTIGRWLNKIVKSDAWIALKEISSVIVNAPNRLMREANFEDLQRELGLDKDFLSTKDPVSPRPDVNVGEVMDNSILPPGRSQSFSAEPPPRPIAEKKPAAKPRTKKTSTSKLKPKKSGPAKPKREKSKDA